jgi:hypothetical protein
MGTTRYRVYQVVLNGSSKILLGPIQYPTGPRENGSSTVLPPFFGLDYWI